MAKIEADLQHIKDCVQRLDERVPKIKQQGDTIEHSIKGLAACLLLNRAQCTDAMRKAFSKLPEDQ